MEILIHLTTAPTKKNCVASRTGGVHCWSMLSLPCARGATGSNMRCALVRDVHVRESSPQSNFCGEQPHLPGVSMP